MRRLVLLLAVLMSSCSDPLSLGGATLGMSEDAFTNRFEDAKRTSFEDWLREFDVASSALGTAQQSAGQDTDVYLRPPEPEQVSSAYVFKQGRLSTILVVYAESANLEDVQASLTGSFGGAPQRQSAMGSTVVVWQRSGWVATLWKLGKPMMGRGPKLSTFLIVTADKDSDSNSDLIFGLILLFNIIWLVITERAFAAYRDFSQRVRSVDSRADLDLYKALAKRDMYSSLIALVLPVLAVGLVIYGFMNDDLGLWTVLVALAFSAFIGKRSMKAKPLVRQIHEIAVASDLRAEFDAVTVQWKTRPFPNW